MLAPQNVPSILGGVFVKVGGLQVLSQVLIGHSFQNLAAMHLLESLELDPDPLGLIGEACIPPPMSRFQAISQTS